MKKSIILAMMGVVLMLVAFSCANTPTSEFEGIWHVTGGIAVDDNDYENYYILIDGDGNCAEYYNDGLTDKVYTWKITENSCNKIKCDNGLEYLYEKSGDSMTWTLNTGSGLVNAIAGAYYKMDKVSSSPWGDE